jgi:uncharacterized RDD family membrane protein YckC
MASMSAPLQTRPPSSFAPPAGAAPPGLARAAPLLRRMAAFLYEGVLVFGILFATGLVYAVTVRQTHGLAHRTGLIATCFLVLGLYFVGLWWRSGQTLAMKTWHLRVLAADGAPLSPRRALVRYLAAWLWILPPLALVSALGPATLAAYFAWPVAWVVLYALAALLHPRRQFWHDALCGTAVVDAPASAPLPQ